LINRRKFIKNSLIAGALLNFPAFSFGRIDKKQPLKISLAEWSLHNTLFGDAREKLGYDKFAEGLRTDSQATMSGKISNLDFPVVARSEFGIDAVEYVNQFFLDKARDEKYLKELNNICSQEGVRSLLIMIDMEGNLASSDKERRSGAIENHLKWIDAAAYLGCHSIRVNLYGDGSAEEQQKYAADSLTQLVEYGDKQNINVIVENHGGFSSDPDWLVGVIKAVDHPRAGTLPDFGNFPDEIDKYNAVKKMMLFAKGVSAKSTNFNSNGDEAGIDYKKMMEIVFDAGYEGYVGIEYSGSIKTEYEGIRKTKKLLKKVTSEIRSSEN
jgi:sugar phosphate isomerase/epimerase